MPFHYQRLAHPLMLLALSAGATAQTSPQPLPEVTVTADFRETSVTELPGSVTVIGEETIADRNALHLEQLLNMAPNVNFSSGASRARFYQIRGIGERSQFIEPVNPSVGVIIDDIDFSGIGTAGTLLDIEQVEILRGPQGTRYGANALAGLIYMKSADPTDELTAKVNGTLANYNTWSASGAVSGPLSDSVSYRIAGQQNRSDGFIENDYLNRDDTNNIDEATLRGKLRWQATDTLTLDFTGLYVDIDNGYDGFSLDNTRHTLSDQPGHDRQETTAAAIKATSSAVDAFRVEVIASGSDSDLEYGYDEDWSYPAICAGLACDGWEYASVDNYLRERQTATLEARLVSTEDGAIFNGSTDWVVGIYGRSQDEDLLRQYTYASGDFRSDYETDRISGYAQLETRLSERLVLTTGLRLEEVMADYRDSDGVDFDTDESLWGGRIALEYLLSDQHLLYGLVSRGYKTGGINSNSSLSDELRDYDTEHMINWEAGVKSSLLDDTLRTQIALFYQQRKDVQVKQSFLVPVSDPYAPGEFIDYFSNAAKGTNYGLEVELQWQPTQQWLFTAALGLLETELKDFVNSAGTDLEGREQAHAPSYQFSLASQYHFDEHWKARLEVEGKDEFYFSDNHEEQSWSYETVGASLTYQESNWNVSLWGRNLTDEDYAVRGFGGFGNDPRKFYAEEPYYQYGEPRTFGISFGYQL